MNTFNLNEIGKLTKAEIEELALEQTAVEIEGGQIDSLSEYVKRKKAIHFLTVQMRTFEPHAIDEYLDHQERGPLFKHSATVTLTHGHPLLDYKQDMVYAEYDQLRSERKKELDNVFRLGKEYADANTGEVIPVVQVKKETKDSLNVSF